MTSRSGERRVLRHDELDVYIRHEETRVHPLNYLVPREKRKSPDMRLKLVQTWILRSSLVNETYLIDVD